MRRVTTAESHRWRIDDVLARTRLDDLLDELDRARPNASARAAGGTARHPTTTTTAPR